MSIGESHSLAFRHVTNDEDLPKPTEVESDKSDLDPAQPKDIQIPVIDLERLDKGILTEACKEWGIFRLKNHRVPLALTSQLQEISKSLLSLPSENKHKLFTAPLSYFSGTPALNPSGNALKREGTQTYMLEGFNVPLYELPSSTRDDDSRLHRFRMLIDEYRRHITRIAVSLFEAIVQTLNLELSVDQRSEYLSESTGLIRVYRYPSVETVGEALGMEVHTDSSVISILEEDETGGLEIMKGEEWFRVKPIANTLIVNLGDMLQVISDDKYKSVKHRVKKIDMMKERHSVCYFVFPKREFVIKSSNYKPFTYSEFEAQVHKDVQSLGSKIGLPRFVPKSQLFL